MQGLFRILFARLIRRGQLTVEFADGRADRFGDGSGPPLHARFTDARAPFDLARNPELALGELYMDGRLVVSGGSLYDLLAMIAGNAVRGAPPGWLTAIRRVRDTAAVLRPRNIKTRSRSNVQHHYDLDDRLYRLFLDSDRQYSCAYFETPEATLEEAQLAKKRHIAAKLLMNAPGQTVLDIGSGWGGLALYLNKHYGADVTGITLSDEQFANATRRAADAGVAEQVRFRIEDYRDTPGPFDRVVSVGMFEHVGAAYYETYFSAVRRLLREDGVALIHTIGRPDGPGTLNPWVTKYIFPGAHLPALSEITTAVERSGLFITDVEPLRIHYADTLLAWRTNFMAHRAEAAALYDERFCRMWEFYMAACEVAFRIEGECVFQVQLARRHDVVPITRDYMLDEERRLRGRESRDREWQVA